eukprot:TRINITY_DN9066_c0_g1_i2.p1 TRINITY_DN9066_c0_g1~~TRINITY_DN9066_c0_g1_i2.p1  ORF type:complete len:243 (-),score=30.49 TRINITY_DN9066_c0_g1_i2:1762-2490(-)
MSKGMQSTQTLDVNQANRVVQLKFVEMVSVILLMGLLVPQVVCQLSQQICYNTDEVIKAQETMRAAANCSNVWMSRSEQALIQAFLDKSKNMLEVGSGYSTLWYSQFVKSYTSIEHDQGWFEKVQQLIKSSAGNRNISYHVAPVSDWDWNQGDGSPEQFKVYLDKIDEVSKGRKWDIVLDDGRARVDVALRVLPYLKPDSLVIIHDFWSRKLYHSVLQSFTQIASVYDGQSMVILKPKSTHL